jgi:fused signal recognition particle receptor
MFEGLKKKFSSFIDSITKKEEQKVEEEAKVEERKEEPTPAPKKEQIEAEAQRPVHHHEVKAAPDEKKVEEKKVEQRPVVEKIQAPEPPKHHVEVHPQKKADERPREAPKVSLGTKLKGIVFRQVRISDKDIEPFLEELRISLIQSDVNYDVVEKILANMQRELTTNPISSSNISANITQIIRKSIFDTLNKRSAIDMVRLIKGRKEANEIPFKILFIGPNGAGKTTQMAKIAHMLIKNNLSCVMSASDTFRAAAIEQTVHHAGKLGIPVIKGKYGADPASVAFDAIAHAKAHNIDVVLIDSAGRQETNKSLMEEIKKMVRVAKPDMKIFVGESIVGNALLNQVREFNQAISLDGIILTKLDADAKGGNTLSILSETEVPVLFFGTGEKYDDLMAYDPEFVVDNIIPRNN